MRAVDFHIHAVRFPINAAERHSRFMERGMDELRGPFAKAVEQHTSLDQYLEVLARAGVECAGPMAEPAQPTRGNGS
jgi:hypothetical protein